MRTVLSGFPFLLAAWASLLAPGCATSDSSEADAFARLTPEKLGELDEKLARWSDARNSGEIVLEDMLRRDLRREAGRLIDSLRLGVASGDLEIRAISAAALGFTEDVSCVGLLLPLVQDADVSVRANALLALCLIRSRRTPVALVSARLTDPEPPVRRLAVLCLAELHDPAVGVDLFTSFVECLKDPDDGVRINASSALERIGDPRGSRFLAEACLPDANAKVRLNAAVGLGKLKAPGTERALAAALRREMNPSVRRELAGALRSVTGRTLGEDADAWDRALDAGGKPAPAAPAVPDPAGAKPDKTEKGN